VNVATRTPQEKLSKRDFWCLTLDSSHVTGLTVTDFAALEW